MAVPLEGENGRVTGALVGAFRMPNLAGALLISVGVGALLLLVPAGFLGLIFGFFTAWGITRRIGALARAARSWSRGDFSVTAKDRSKDELGQLSRELNQMAADLENLLQARGELATLEARNRFARDLHDSVKQQVFATSLQIAAARALIRKDTDSAESHLGQADDLVRQAQKELNILIAEMRPAALEGKGLAAALREYVARWSEGAEIPADFRVRGERETRKQILLYSILLYAVTQLPFCAGGFGGIYLGASIVLGAVFVGGAVRLYRRGESGSGAHAIDDRAALLSGDRRAALWLYLYSLAYLALLFASMVTDARL